MFQRFSVRKRHSTYFELFRAISTSLFNLSKPRIWVNLSKSAFHFVPEIAGMTSPAFSMAAKIFEIRTIRAIRVKKMRSLSKLSCIDKNFSIYAALISR